MIAAGGRRDMHGASHDISPTSSRESDISLADTVTSSTGSVPVGSKKSEDDTTAPKGADVAATVYDGDTFVQSFLCESIAYIAGEN
ncbi:hypothetical protein XA68_11428 [Ophiocordyceps unilateralis]|uniref:Uncharacterized protein n=1 Tax=Ophiocordyceps unilateralis TaxID=268505 RepID=A0A2A9PPW4_OPHUN|nr:hypothetical protein XA68_11428 [Ophiocordyceps unilateralis]